LDDLVAGANAAGITVRTRIEGDPRRLPAGVDLAAFRIVQEALTNVARHAGPASATVTIRYQGRELAVQVDDDGRGAPPDQRRHHAGPAPGGGNGIRGMRERAEALGGQLAAENRPGGGFRVEAMLPLDGTGPEGGIDPASDTPDAAGEQREEAAERGVPW
ncbi:MAG TPA: ATP-binding protein, partial [Actinomycetota bacterium]